MFGTKEAMIEQADERIIDLKSRGFENAGLYNPAGVGGTHVMYVLHHADKPDIYAGLPKNPKISPLVQLWKGGFKIFGLATLAFATIGGFFHYVTAGPDEVPPEEEEEAAHAADHHP
jgi:formate dehydrogenase iron-sulfur subunit